MELNIRKIRSFALVAEHRSFRRAAEELHVSTSALSTQVRELEDTLGVSLLYRTTRSVKLTVEGVRFLERTKHLLAEVDSVVEEFRTAASSQREQVTIACMPAVTSSILLRAISKYRDRYPKHVLRVFDENSSRIAHCVEHGQADFGICPIPENPGDFEFWPLLEDVIVALVPSGHPFAERQQIAFADLAKYPFVAPKNSHSLRTILKSAEREAGVALTPAFELMHHYTAASIVQAGLGVAIMPSLNLPMANLPGVVSVAITSPRMSRLIGVIYRKGDTLGRSAKQFLSVLSATVNAPSAVVME